MLTRYQGPSPSSFSQNLSCTNPLSIGSANGLQPVSGSPQEIVDGVQKKVASDINNVAFVTGKLLRIGWDTFIQPYVDAGVDYVRSAYSWFSERLTWNDVNKEALRKNFNSEQCDVTEKEKWLEGYPQAIIAAADDGDDHQFNSLRTKLLISELSQQYHVHFQMISSISGICEIIEKVKELGPIKLLIISGHGSPESIRLGKDFNDSEFPLIWVYSKHQKLRCLSGLATGADIVLDSCSTAGENTIFFGSMRVPMNMHMLIASYAPNCTVLAPAKKILKGSLKIDLFPSVAAYGLLTDAFFGSRGITDIALFLLMHLLRDKLKLFDPHNQALNALGIYNQINVARIMLYVVKRDLFKLKNPHLDPYLLSSFEKISPANADFCQKTLPYFNMKRYCDVAGIRPSVEEVLECETDPGCIQAVKQLKMLRS